MKKIPWLDTVRVFASFAVILGHFVSCFDGFDGFDKMRLFFFHMGNVGVFLFFVLSGYLIRPSLERAPDLWTFYKKKLVRVVVPFTVCYIVLGAALVALAPLELSIAQRSPFYHAMYQSGFPWGVFNAMFPVDVNLMMFFDLPLVWFVGEWFMGVLLWLYLISPLLDKLIRRAPFVTFAASIVLSVGIFYAVEPFVLEGRIMTGWWLFPTRIPEFLFGMLLFAYKDFIEQHRRKILCGVTVWAVAVGAAEIIYFSDVPALLTRLFPLEPYSMLMSIPCSYLFFELADWLNEKFPSPLAWFNGFSDVSYMVMLTQHVILYIFAAGVEFEKFHSFGPFLMFTLNTIVIVYVSEAIKKFSDPVERRLMKRK